MFRLGLNRRCSTSPTSACRADAPDTQSRRGRRVAFCAALFTSLRHGLASAVAGAHERSASFRGDLPLVSSNKPADHPPAVLKVEGPKSPTHPYAPPTPYLALPPLVCHPEPGAQDQTDSTDAACEQSSTQAAAQEPHPSSPAEPSSSTHPSLLPKELSKVASCKKRRLHDVDTHGRVGGLASRRKRSREEPTSDEEVDRALELSADEHSPVSWRSGAPTSKRFRSRKMPSHRRSLLLDIRDEHARRHAVTPLAEEVLQRIPWRGQPNGAAPYQPTRSPSVVAERGSPAPTGPVHGSPSPSPRRSIFLVDDVGGNSVNFTVSHGEFEEVVAHLRERGILHLN